MSARILYPVPDHRPRPLQPRRDWVHWLDTKLAELDAIAETEGLKNDQLSLDEEAA